MTRLPLFLAATLALGGCHYVQETRVIAPPMRLVVADSGPVSIQLATFRQPEQEQDNWLRITRDYPVIGQYRPRMVTVPDLPYTRIYELYIDSVPGNEAAALCAEMLANGAYCAIQAATMEPMPPAAMPAEPIMAPPPAPPPGDKPRP